MRRYLLLLVLIVIPSFMASLAGFSQNECPDLLTETDILTVERGLSNCAGRFTALIDQVNSALAAPDIQPAAKARYLIYAGLLYNADGNVYESTTILQRAVTASRDAQSRQLEAWASYYTGLVFHDSGQDDRAETWLNQAQSVAEAVQDHLIMGRLKLMRGLDALEAGRNEDALVFLEDAFPYLMAVPALSVPEQIENLNGLARVERIFEKFNRGQVLAAQANALRDNPDLYANFEQGAEAGACTLTDIENATDFLAVERALGACAGDAAALQERIQAARQNTNDNATIGRLQMLSGLVYEAQRDYYSAVRSFEQALGTFRGLSDKNNEALDLYYLGRSYMARQQYDNGLQFINLAGRIAEEVGDRFTSGRVQLAIGRYTLNNLQNYGEAERLLNLALPNLQTLGDDSHPEQLETLYLLNRAYAGLGDAPRAAQYDQLYRDLRGTETQVIDTSENANCPFTSLAFQYDVVLVERLLGSCRSSYPALMLTAQAAYYTSNDDRVKGIMQIYVGFGLQQYDDFLNAPLAFDRAIVHLQKIGDQQLLGLAHYYLALVYYQNRENQLGANNLDAAQNAARKVNDNFTVGRVIWRFANIELDKDNYRVALNLYQQAYDLLAVNPIPALPEQRDIARNMIFIYSDEIDLDDEEQRWREILDSLDNAPTTVQPTPAPTQVVEPGATSDPGTETVTGCNPKAVVRLESLVEVEDLLPTCDSLGSVLLEGQTALSQAETPAEKAYYENFVGVVQQAQGQYYDAFLSHGRAVNLYRELDDNAALALTYYYYGRAIYARSGSDEGINFLRDSERRATEVGDTHTVAEVNLWFANLSFSSGDIRTTVAYLEKARTNFEASESLDEATAILLRLAKIYEQWSLFDTALDYYTQTGENAEQLGDDTLFVEANLGFARYHKYFGRYEQAREYANLARGNAVDPVAKVLASAELASIATELEDYETARQLLDTIDPKQFDCGIGDQLRVYRGDYLVAIGRAGEATAVYREIIGNECATRLPVTLANAYAGVADAELVRGSSNQIILDAINASRAESARLNFPEPDYPRGDQRSRLQEAEYYRRLRQYDRVIELVSDVQRSAETYTDLRGQVDATMLLVTVGIDRGQYQNTLDLLATASDLYKQMDFTIGLSKTVEQQVRIYIDQARYNDAITFIEFARSQYSVLPISFDSRINFYEAILLEKRGRTEEALALYEVARSGFEQSGEILSVLDVDLQRVGLLHRRSGYDEARRIILDARTTAEGLENSYYIAQSELLLGDNYVLAFLFAPELSPGLDAAEPPYSRALELYSLVGNVAGEALINIRLGELELLLIERNASTRQATRYLNRALELYRSLDNSFGEADALNDLGRYYLLTRDYNKAIDFSNDTLRVIGENDPFLRADVYTTLGLAYEYRARANGLNRADLLQAIEHYRQATQLISFVYAEIADIDAQRSYAVQERSLLPYNRLIRIYALNIIDSREQDALTAFFYAEQSRARSYLTQLQGGDITFGEDNPALQEWQTLRADTINLNRTLKDVRQRAGDQAETATIETQIEANIRRMQELETQISLPLLQLMTVNVADFETIQDSLPNDTTMVIYYVIPGQQTPVELESTRIMAFVIQPTGGLTLLPIRVDDYEQNIRNQVTGILQNRSQASAGRLYTTLVQPLRPTLDSTPNLVIVPHAILNYVPFEMLWDGTDWMVSDFTITYAPSATVFSLLQNSISQSSHGEQLLALGYSGEGYEDRGLAPLRYYDNEVEKISEIHGDSQVFLDEQAGEMALSELHNLDVIHIAAHGIFDNRNPLQSFLALAPDPANESDGALQVREIYNLSLGDNHPLIVLSACDLARNRIQQGDEVEGMTRAFLLTGARGVVASFWPVDDLSTTHFMELFYEFRSQGKSEADALTATKRAMIADPAYNDVNYWAAFVLVGIPR